MAYSPWHSVLKNVELGLEKMKVPKEKREEIAMKNIVNSLA